MKFKPMTKAQMRNLLPEDEYPFEITAAEEKLSKAGNPMIALTLRVLTPEGNFVFLNDWLLQPFEGQDSPDQLKGKTWKIRNFCYATFLNEQYDAGSLTDENCLGKKGWIKVKIRQNEVSDQNYVASYIEDKSLKESSKAQEKKDVAKESSNDFVDDDILF
jgi:hypothetical protein